MLLWSCVDREEKQGPRQQYCITRNNYQNYIYSIPHPPHLPLAPWGQRKARQRSQYSSKSWLIAHCSTAHPPPSLSWTTIRSSLLENLNEDHHSSSRVWKIILPRTQLAVLKTIRMFYSVAAKPLTDLAWNINHHCPWWLIFISGIVVWRLIVGIAAYAIVGWGDVCGREGKNEVSCSSFPSFLLRLYRRRREIRHRTEREVREVSDQDTSYVKNKWSSLMLCLFDTEGTNVWWMCPELIISFSSYRWFPSEETNTNLPAKNLLPTISSSQERIKWSAFDTKSTRFMANTGGEEKERKIFFEGAKNFR